jgi:hypothetical protein
MILEMADIRIRPGSQAAFDAAIRRGVETVIAKAIGFRGYKVNRGVESPDRYVLMSSGIRSRTTPSTSATPRRLPNGAPSSAPTLP